jgi:hypothetical protein
VIGKRGGAFEANDRQEAGAVLTQPIPARFEDTVSARWRIRLAGVRANQRRHWRTKTAYYAAVCRLLDDGVVAPGWADVIDAVEPRGSRSTFYEVTGAHAKHPLIGELLAQDAVDLIQLALYYRRESAVDQLIDEAKVWTYWPYRDFLRSRYRIEPNLEPSAAVRLLLSAVESWARGNASLASALDCAPPLCAVEDLLMLCPGQYSAVSALSTLTRVIRDATDAVSEPLVGAAR